MTTLSTRYVGPLLALLLPALFAVWGYSYGEFRSDECADPSALLETGWIEGLESENEPDGKIPPWLLQDIGGTIATKGSELSALEFRIVRSFELERLYEMPVRFFSEWLYVVAAQHTLEWIGPQGEELPIYRVFEQTPRFTRLGAYMFLYDSRPLANPSLELLSATLRRVVTGHRPLTLVTASVYTSDSHREAAEELVDEWLVSAWEYYRSVCGP
jgi:hypothetical protein